MNSNVNWVGPYPPGQDPKSGGLRVEATTFSGRLIAFFAPAVFNCGEMLTAQAWWPFHGPQRLVQRGGVVIGWEHAPVLDSDGLTAGTAIVRLRAWITNNDPHPVVVVSVSNLTRDHGKPAAHACRARLRYTLRPDPNG